jgi:hypothetical protein
MSTMPHAVAHAAAKRGVVAREKPANWSPPSILKSPEVLTAADVVEAEAESRALQRHALEVIDSGEDSTVVGGGPAIRRDRRSPNVGTPSTLAPKVLSSKFQSDPF